ncbi:Eukaryotic translation initiation factor 4B [Yamadazyma tenuis]|uniref:Eukaryotic translation initiation factor 4B n=1 Tax=Candida tenuis TaxID=2315449 RepID=UPI0027A89C75|nr:Eukaryotic translation initiation factor 4B [Yamadazyma tenuis]
MAPKKNIKMDLGSFLADDSLGGGSWADEEVDFGSIGVPTASAPSERRAFSGSNDYSGQSARQAFEDQRPERKEFPIPDQPPYRARIGNLPWDIVEEDVQQFFEKRMQMTDVVSDVKLPADPNGRLKGFGFVTFSERDILEEALQLTLSDFNGRKIFVNVAAPQKSGFDMDWRGGRSGPLSGGRDREDQPELDWGAARNEQSVLPPRERSDRGDRGDREERRPRRADAEFDWNSARTEQTELPPRERRERRERKPDAEFDWSAARSEQVTLPPRERVERGERSIRRPRKPDADFDWGAARSEQVALPPRERSNRKPRKQDPELDWGTARTEKAVLPPRAARTPKKEESKEAGSPGPQKSAFDVLADESGDEEEAKPVAPAEPSLAEQTANLSISNDVKEEVEDGWEVVRK